MALKTKIEFISQDRSGREIIVKDDTGFESLGRGTGYGTTNGLTSEILAYYFSVSKYASGYVYFLKIDGSDELLPTPEQLSIGTPLTLTTSLFKEKKSNGYTEPTCIFKDGILDLNMYVEFPGMSGVTITKGTGYILFEDSYELEDIDSVVVNGVMYDVDHSKDNQAGTILYILGEFEEDASSFTICYRANTKAYLSSVSENIHAYSSASMIDQLDNYKWEKIHVALCFREAANLFYKQDDPDYWKAHKLLESSFELLKNFSV